MWVAAATPSQPNSHSIAIAKSGSSFSATNAHYFEPDATLSAAGQPARAEFQPRGPRPVEVVVHVRGDASKACREGGEFFPMVTESLCPS